MGDIGRQNATSKGLYWRHPEPLGDGEGLLVTDGNIERDCLRH